MVVAASRSRPPSRAGGSRRAVRVQQDFDSPLAGHERYREADHEIGPGLTQPRDQQARNKHPNVGKEIVDAERPGSTQVDVPGAHAVE